MKQITDKKWKNDWKAAKMVPVRPGSRISRYCLPDSHGGMKRLRTIYWKHGDFGFRVFYNEGSKMMYNFITANKRNSWPKFLAKRRTNQSNLLKQWDSRANVPWPWGSESAQESKM